MFIELFFEFCHIFINFASKTIIKVMTIEEAIRQRFYHKMLLYNSIF